MRNEIIIRLCTSQVQCSLFLYCFRSNRDEIVDLSSFVALTFINIFVNCYWLFIFVCQFDVSMESQSVICCFAFAVCLLVLLFAFCCLLSAVYCMSVGFRN